MKFVAPSIHEKSFTCPHCGVLARQYKWGHELKEASQGIYGEPYVANAPLRISRCENYGKNCMWVGLSLRIIVNDLWKHV